MQKIFVMFIVLMAAGLLATAALNTGNGVISVLSVAMLLVLALFSLIAFFYFFWPLQRLLTHVQGAGTSARDLPRDFDGTLKTASSEIRNFARVFQHLQQQAGQAEAARIETSAAATVERELAERTVQEARQSCAETQELLTSMGALAGKGQSVIRNIFGALRELAQGASTMGQGVNAQVDKTQESSEVMAHMRHSVGLIAESASSATHGVQDARSRAESSSNDVQQAVHAISAVQKSTQTLTETMHALNQQADTIGQVMGIIQEVADQTNLLALNAAIEAARAGDAGKGFAVVADEVRALAVKTMSATTDVDEAVRRIQLQTRQNLQAVAVAGEDISVCVTRAEAAEASMHEIIQTMQSNADQLADIHSATEKQTANSAAVDAALSEIAKISEDNSSYSDQVNNGVNQISSLLGDLEMIVHALLSGNAELAASSKLVQWTPALATGVSIVDAHHKSLCAMINDLHDAMRTRESQSVMEKLISGLKDYTSMHFSAEEKIFERSAYPDVEAHKKLHRTFVAKIAEYEQGLRTGTATVSMDLLNFLKDWLIRHIQGTDLKYSPYVLKSRTEKR